MSTGIVEGRQVAALNRRVRQFYDQMTRRQFENCYRTLDPMVRQDPQSVTLHQYTESLRRFMDRYGQVRIVRMTWQLFLNRPSRLYANRDFAIGETIWEDEAGQEHTFKQRWIRHGRSWYARGTGYAAGD